VASNGQRFRRRALRRGYKVDEVDAFLDRVEATLNGEPGPPVAAAEVHDVVFRVRFGGYDEWQVDLHLDRVERQLGELEERGGFIPARGPERMPKRDDRPLPPRDDRAMPPPIRDDRMMPPPLRDDRTAPLPPAPPRPGPSMPAPVSGGYGRFDEPPGRFDEPSPFDKPGGSFGGPSFSGFEPGRHGKADMTTEMRMPPDIGREPGPPPPPPPPPPSPSGGGFAAGSGFAGGTGSAGAGAPLAGEAHRIDQLRRTFVPRRFGSGYDPAQVDRLFEGIIATVSGRGGGSIPDSELDPSQFNLVPGGYFEAEVDQALREVRDIIRRR
jgi:DivIVA domain-containing protein